MKIKINLNACLKTGQCYYTFPEWVSRGEDDGPNPTKDEIPDEQLEDLNELIACCPVGAIRLAKSEPKEK